MIKTLKKLFSLLMAIDQADIKPLKFISAEKKSKLVRLFFDAFIPFFPDRAFTLNGLKFFIPKNLIRAYVLQSHEPEVTEFFRQRLKPGMTVLDVGANIGYHSIFAAKCVGPKGKVYAVEPGKDNLKYLKRNVQKNGIDNIEILPFAAGKKKRLRDFYLLKLSLQNSFYLYAQSSDNIIETVQVQEMPLDDIISEKVDFLKIDIEGSELDALEGMKNILENSPQIRILIEWNPLALNKSGHNMDALPNRLKSFGFELFILNKNIYPSNNLVGNFDLCKNALQKSWLNIYAEKSI